MTISTYTVIGKTSDFLFLKEGCCGGVIRVPTSTGLVADLLEDIDVRKTLVKGLDVHEIFINGEWVEIKYDLANR